MKSFNNIITSELCLIDTIIDIPLDIKRFVVHYYVESGEPIIYLHSLENNPPLKLYTGAKWNSRFYERIIDRIIIQPKGGKVWVIIEHF